MSINWNNQSPGSAKGKGCCLLMKSIASSVHPCEYIICPWASSRTRLLLSTFVTSPHYYSQMFLVRKFNHPSPSQNSIPHHRQRRTIKFKTLSNNSESAWCGYKPSIIMVHTHIKFTTFHDPDFCRKPIPYWGWTEALNNCCDGRHSQGAAYGRGIQGRLTDTMMKSSIMASVAEGQCLLQQEVCKEGRKRKKWHDEKTS